MTRFAKHMPGPVKPSDPWSDDVLNRKKLADDLTTALSTITQPFVLGLHSEFGNGKTFFIQRWRQDLDNAGDVAVYFNAWETDYVQEPLIAFTAAIKKQLEDHDLLRSKETAKDLATSAGRIVVKGLLPRAISLFTSGAVQASDIAALKAIGHEISGAAAEITDRAIDEAVKHHEETRDEIELFRANLADCAKAIATREAGRVRRLIIFIDELDRCRPDYAVQVLECIKHFFSKPHVVFVVAIDRDTLNAAVQAVYGAISIDGYLRKFFDYHVELESPSDDKFVRLVAKSLEFDSFVGDHFEDIIGLVGSWCQSLELSLREQEHVIAHVNFMARMYEPGNTFRCEVIVLLSIIRAKCPELFEEIENKKIGIQELLVKIEQKSKFLGDWNEIAKEKLYHGKVVLLAALFSSNTIESEKRRLEAPIKSELKELLDEAANRSPSHSQGGWPGLSIARRMRFLSR